MRNISGTIILLVALCISSPAQIGLNGVKFADPKLIRAGRILDVRAGTYLLDQGILTEGQAIKEIGPWLTVQSHAPKEASMIDLSRATLLPGLIDCHAHLLISMDGRFDGGQNLTINATLYSPSFRSLIGARSAREYLEAGITSARNLGLSGVDGDIALRDAIRTGLVPGPRIQASGRRLAPLGGQALYAQAELAPLIAKFDFYPISGPDEARRAVRENAAIGVNLIKIVIDAGAGPFWPFRYLPLEDAKAAVEDAHRLGIKVAAHATQVKAIQIAIDAGVDSIEHANEATDEQLKQMKEKGIWLVATDMETNGRQFEYYHHFFENTPENIAAIKQGDQQNTIQLRDRLQRAMKIGVKVAAGSDNVWGAWPGKSRGEASLLMLAGLHDEGMPNIDVIRSSTVNAAELMGWSHLVGEIAVGKLADIIAVEGDPLQQIDLLQHVHFVMKGGAVVRNDFANK